MIAGIYQFCEGATEIGVDTADADARSTRAGLEAKPSAMYCESQRRQERVGVCMLNSLRRSAHRTVTKGRWAPLYGSQGVMVMKKSLLVMAQKPLKVVFFAMLRRRESQRPEGECCWRQNGKTVRCQLRPAAKPKVEMISAVYTLPYRCMHSNLPGQSTTV